MALTSRNVTPRIALLALVVLALVIGGIAGKWWVSGVRPQRSLTEPAQGITFNGEVASLILSNCATCHHTGGSAPFSLTTYTEVQKHAKDIIDVTARRYMPPWLPEHGYGRFANERYLTDHQIELLAQWVRQGMALGVAQLKPATIKFSDDWRLGKPDLIVRMPQPFELPAEGTDVYRNFVMPVALPAAKYIRAVELRPGNPKAVHHAFLLVDPTPESRRLDGKDAEVGFAGMNAGDGARTPDTQFASWQPGKTPTDAGEAWLLRKGADLVFQLHMRPSGKPEPIQGSVGLYFTESRPAGNVFRLLLRSTAIDIPAGKKDYMIEASYKIPVGIDVLSVLPHAHYLGKRLAGWAVLPDGKQEVPLIRINDWDFNWQGDYPYSSPVSLPAGTTLHMRYTYDNSDENVHNPARPAVPVKFGPNTTDEMGELWLLVRAANRNDIKVLTDDYVQTWATPDAIAYRKGILQRNPNDSVSHARLGSVLVTAGRVDEGEQHLRTALRLSPTDSMAAFNLGKVLQSRKDAAGARGMFERAVASDSENYKARNELGVILLHDGSLPAAEEQFLAAAGSNPSDAKAHVNLGLIAHARGDVAGAAREFQNALDIDPDDTAARENLAKVRAVLKRSTR